MSLSGKTTKTTEKFDNKYKTLNNSYLYLTFRRLSILFIDLIAVHEVLP